MEAVLTLEQQVLAVIAEQLGLDAREVRLDASLVDDYNCDSLDAVELIMAVEEEFEIAISDEEAETVKTGRDILAIVERARG